MLDCDAVYHQMLLRTDQALREPLSPAAFGPVFRRDGSLDRQKLGTLVFSDHAGAGPAQRHRVRIPTAGADAPEDGGTVRWWGWTPSTWWKAAWTGCAPAPWRCWPPAEQRVRAHHGRGTASAEEYARLRISGPEVRTAYYREHCTDVLENQL